ncbi:unnamed protein product, partial [Discosporangium mesarthrocarpum]
QVARYKELNERTKLAKRKQEATLAEVMRKRQEVREWADAERSAVESWCLEQRQAAAREKRNALKHAQAMRSRAQATGGVGGGGAMDRRQRNEIEALKATVERAKLEAEAVKKKARANERRLQQQVKAQMERVSELEGQVSFLERQRLETLTLAGGGGVEFDHLGDRGAITRASRSGNVGSGASSGRSLSGWGRPGGRVGSRAEGPGRHGQVPIEVGQGGEEGDELFRERVSATG